LSSLSQQQSQYTGGEHNRRAEGQTTQVDGPASIPMRRAAARLCRSSFLSRSRSERHAVRIPRGIFIRRAEIAETEIGHIGSRRSTPLAKTRSAGFFPYDVAADGRF
jgi:hypothetical protein